MLFYYSSSNLKHCFLFFQLSHSWPEAQMKSKCWRSNQEQIISPNYNNSCIFRLGRGCKCLIQNSVYEINFRNSSSNRLFWAERLHSSLKTFLANHCLCSCLYSKLIWILQKLWLIKQFILIALKQVKCLTASSFTTLCQWDLTLFISTLAILERFHLKQCKVLNFKNTIKILLNHVFSNFQLHSALAHNHRYYAMGSFDLTKYNNIKGAKNNPVTTVEISLWSKWTIPTHL